MSVLPSPDLFTHTTPIPLLPTTKHSIGIAFAPNPCSRTWAEYVTDEEGTRFRTGTYDGSTAERVRLALECARFAMANGFDCHVHHPRTRRAILTHSATPLPEMRDCITPASALPSADQDGRVRHLFELLGVASPISSRSRKVITVATDGSHGSYTGVASWAWVTGDGRWAAGVARRGARTHIGQAELFAVMYAVEMLHSRESNARKLRVLTDNQHVKQMLSGAVRIPSWAQQGVDRINAVRSHTPVSVEWVRGHADSPLNNAADRLAVLTRRTFERGAGSEPPAKNVENILSDLRADVTGSARGTVRT
jgi:ribonuclease HI